jgi:YD repeat-containing protein
MNGDANHSGDLASDRSTYGPSDDNCATDPYFDCPHEVCDDPSKDAIEIVSDILTNYVPVYDESDVLQGYFSVWYLLDDPDGIAGCVGCTTSLSQNTIDLFTGVQQGLTDGLYTEYDYFRGVYMFAKELAIAVGYDEFVADSSCPNTTSSPQSYEDGYLVTNPGLGNNTPEGFVAHFPQNPMFEDLDGCETIDGGLALQELILDNQTGYIADNCEATCTAFALDWMAQLGECIPAADTQKVRRLLVQICSESCDIDNPMGTDEHAGGVYDSYSTQTFYDFEDVITYYGTACTVPVHPQTDPASGTCSCQNLNDFIVGTGYDPTVVGEQDDIELAFNALFEPAGSYTWSQIEDWLDECDNAEPDVANLTGMPEPILCGEPEERENDFFEQASADCDDESATIQGNVQSTLYDYLLQQAADNYITAYRATCMDLVDREVFTVTFEQKEYYYTLYYYDQAGNLVQTVPPLGVDILTGGPLAAVHPFRVDGTGMATYPSHTLVTNYKYNSLQQLIESTTPDGGTATFWYDEHGRIVFSQNARQAALSSPAPAYSYTLYDALGRPYEAGEMYSSTPLDYETSRDPAARATWYTAAIGADDKTQVVHTYYDDQIPGSGTNDYVFGGQLNLRNRVASVTYEEADDADDLTFDNASHYSYDIHGNVSTLVQENRNFNLEILGQSKKQIDYEYDIASGKVLAVHYQQNTGDIIASMDEFHHRYEYDANNRITAVYTSRDGYIWDRDANYLYYDHGAMARTELGHHHVQAQDYAYTIHGWIKGVNSDTRHAMPMVIA